LQHKPGTLALALIIVVVILCVALSPMGGFMAAAVVTDLLLRGLGIVALVLLIMALLKYLKQ
jgi:hypothetical protein